MDKIMAILSMLLLPACSYLTPRFVSSTDLDVQGELIFKSAVPETAVAAKEAFISQGWKVLYEGCKYPPQEYSYFSNRAPLTNKSYDRIAWDKSLSAAMDPKYFITGKTPTSGFSFGAELFITIFDSPESGSIVSITASTSQVAEKKKLEQYINEYASKLNESID